MDASIICDKQKININGTISVTVSADEPFQAYEARLVQHDDAPIRGEGINALYDEGISDEDGIVWLDESADTVSFDISGTELGQDGAYDLYVFLLGEDDVWYPDTGTSGGGGGMEEEEEELD